MTEFHRNCWEKRLPPLEALRQIQLAMYHGYSPRRKQLVRGSGTKVTIDPAKIRDSAAQSSPRPATLPEFYWAGFVLSGIDVTTTP